MSRGVRPFGAGYTALLLALAPLVSGCPLNDDYYVLRGSDAAGAVSAGASSGGSGGRGGAANGSTGGSSAILTGGAGGSGTSSAGSSGGNAGSAVNAAAGQTGCSGDCLDDCSSARFRGHDYAFCPGDLTYAQAELACADGGMRLALVADDDENDFLLQNATANYQGEQIRAFLGATDVVTEGEWVWKGGIVFWRGGPDGEAATGRYVNWADDQPADHSPVTLTGEDCLTINFSDGSWNDMRCEVPLPFVCERPD